MTAHVAPQQHHPALAHHFDTLDQQQEAASLGMWMFLLTEILFFGGLFLVYTIYRSWYPGAFASASHHLDIPLGTVALSGNAIDFKAESFPLTWNPTTQTLSGHLPADAGLLSASRKHR